MSNLTVFNSFFALLYLHCASFCRFECSRHAVWLGFHCDHVIVRGDNSRYFSFQEKGLVKNPYMTCQINYQQLEWDSLAEHLGYTVKRIGNYHTLKEMDSIHIYGRSHWCRSQGGMTKRRTVATRLTSL